MAALEEKPKKVYHRTDIEDNIKNIPYDKFRHIVEALPHITDEENQLRTMVVVTYASASRIREIIGGKMVYEITFRPEFSIEKDKWFRPPPEIESHFLKPLLAENISCIKYTTTKEPITPKKGVLLSVAVAKKRNKKKVRKILIGENEQWIIDIIRDYFFLKNENGVYVSVFDGELFNNDNKDKIAFFDMLKKKPLSYWKCLKYIKTNFSKELNVPESRIGTHILRHCRAQHLADVHKLDLRQLVGLIKWDRLEQPLTYVQEDDEKTKEQIVSAIIPEPKNIE